MRCMPRSRPWSVIRLVFDCFGRGGVCGCVQRSHSAGHISLESALLFTPSPSFSAPMDRWTQWLASHVLAQAGTNPKYIMLAMMYLGVFLSMWISNVAAAVLCVSVILPVIRPFFFFFFFFLFPSSRSFFPILLLIVGCLALLREAVE